MQTVTVGDQQVPYTARDLAALPHAKAIIAERERAWLNANLTDFVGDNLETAHPELSKEWDTVECTGIEGGRALWITGRGKCSFCDGSGDLYVMGRNGKHAYVGCPECDSTGKKDGDDNGIEFSTDMDGNDVRLGAA